MRGKADVEVLLATYNGERYLSEQIDSILAQDYPNLRVLARDDSSQDGTPAVLNEYESRFPGYVRVLRSGHATGSAKDNFLQLLRASTGKYVCLSDQDDVWIPQKVTVTMRCMDQLEASWGAKLPFLVFTDLRVVDENLRTLHDSFWKHEKVDTGRVHRFGALLGQNVVTGCTALLNRNLVELALRMPSEAYMHDQWVALLASGMGKAIALDAQTVLYRQHQRNVVGSRQRTASLTEFIRRVRNGEARQKQWRTSQKQAESFLRIHQAELPAQQRDQLLAFLRCGQTRSNLVRTFLLIRHGFLPSGILEKLAMLTDQWAIRTTNDFCGHHDD